MPPTSGLDAEWRHHALTTPPIAAVSLYAADAAASYLHHPGAVITAAVVAAVVGGAAGILTHRHMWVLLHMAAAVAVAAAWIIYTQLTSPFTAAAITPLVVALAALWPLYPVAHAAERRDRTGALDRAQRILGKSAARGDWPTMLTALGCPGLTVEETLPNRAGYTKVLRLPADGSVTYRRVRGIVERIEVALDVEQGWVRTERGRGARVLVHVTTRDVLAETIPLPEINGPLSINDPFGIGLAETGEVMRLLWREIATLIVGLRGSGKSALLNALLAYLSQCADCVIWMIDLKGGRTAHPWLQPWLDGKTERPVIDWVATTAEEAELMLHACLTGIDVRSHSGAGGEKITPSAQQPAVILICEEVAMLFGQHAQRGSKLAALGMGVTQLGRSEAIDPVFITQRGTVTMTGGGDLKSQCKRRIALGVSSAADARLVFDDSTMAGGVAALVHPGSLYVQDDDARPVPVKAYWTEFERIAGLAERCSWLRPGIEQSFSDALGAVYADRWSMQRAGHLIKGARLPAHTPPPTVAPPRVAGSGPAPSSTGLPAIPKPPADAQPAWRTAKGAPIPRKFDPAQFDAAFAELSARLGDVEGGAGHPGRLRLLGLLAQAGRAGLGPGEITQRLNGEGIACVRQTVHEWLADAVRDGSVVKRDKGVYVTAEFS